MVWFWFSFSFSDRAGRAVGGNCGSGRGRWMLGYERAAWCHRGWSWGIGRYLGISPPLVPVPSPQSHIIKYSAEERRKGRKEVFLVGFACIYISLSNSSDSRSSPWWCSSAICVGRGLSLSLSFSLHFRPFLVPSNTYQALTVSWK
jgi:hypothetical protein